MTLPGEGFTNVLPMLRRTFGEFSSPERSQIGQVVQSGKLVASTYRGMTKDDLKLDMRRALPALITVTEIFDLPAPVDMRDD